MIVAWFWFLQLLNIASENIKKIEKVYFLYLKLLARENNNFLRASNLKFLFWFDSVEQRALAELIDLFREWITTTITITTTTNCYYHYHPPFSWTTNVDEHTCHCSRPLSLFPTPSEVTLQYCSWYRISNKLPAHYLIILDQSNI